MKTLNNHHIEKQLERIESLIITFSEDTHNQFSQAEKERELIAATLQNFMQKTANSFTEIDGKFKKIDERFSTIDQKFIDLEEGFNKKINNVGILVEYLDGKISLVAEQYGDIMKLVKSNILRITELEFKL